MMTPDQFRAFADGLSETIEREGDPTGLLTRAVTEARRDADRVTIIHDRTPDAALYPCDRVGCDNRATLVYQGPRHPAIYGACDDHRCDQRQTVGA